MMTPMMFSNTALPPLDLADQGELVPLTAIALHDDDPNPKNLLTHETS